MKLTLALSFAALLPLAPPTAALGTLTVGPLGSGAGFTEIQAAIDAAQPGDTILVAAGSYAGFAVDGKPLRILGAGSSAVMAGTWGAVPLFQPPQRGALHANLPPGSTTLVSGISFGASGSPLETIDAVLADTCAGRVVLHDVEVEMPWLDTSVTNLVHVRACEEVWLSESSLLGGASSFGVGTPTPALAANDSVLWVFGSNLRGGSGGANSIFTPALPGQPGLVLHGSIACAARSAFHGGDGGTGSTGGVTLGREGGPGIVADGSDAKLVGGPAPSSRVGTARSSHSRNRPVVRGSSSRAAPTR